MNNIIIIGAPRSGTNMLRDTLTTFKGVGTWPCDEINYIWRFGNKEFPSDEFTPDMATEKVKEYIRSRFIKLRKKKYYSHIVEKTCANSLRVDFVKEILPDAKFIFIYRNGIDAIASAYQRWKSNIDIFYTIKKIPYVP